MADAGPRKKDETSSRAVAAAAPPAPVAPVTSQHTQVKVSIGAPDAVRTEIELTFHNQSAEEGRAALTALNAPAGAATSFGIDLLLKEGVDMFELGELCGVIKLGWAEGVVPKLPEAFVRDSEWMSAKGGLTIKPSKREDGRDMLRISTHFCMNPLSKLQEMNGGVPVGDVVKAFRLSLGLALEQLSALAAPEMTLGEACRAVLELDMELGIGVKAVLRALLRNAETTRALKSGGSPAALVAKQLLRGALGSDHFELDFGSLAEFLLFIEAGTAQEDRWKSKVDEKCIDAIPTRLLAMLLGGALFQVGVPATLAQLRGQVLDKIVGIETITLQVPCAALHLHLRNVDIVPLVPDEAWESIPPRERTAGNWRRMLDALATRGGFNPALFGVSHAVSLLLLDALGGTAGQVSKEGPSARARRCTLPAY